MKKMKPLMNVEYEKLVWDKFPFELVRLSTDVDGSCYFHAICKAYFKPYITGKVSDKNLNRRDFVKSLRKDLSKMLPKSYQKLANGELLEISKSMDEYTLENMQKNLDSNEPVSNVYNEFISDQLNIDLYILDSVKRDVYMTGTDDKLLYKDRPSVVLLYLPGHYELVGLMHSNNRVETYFEPDSPFILRIKERMNELVSKK